MTILISKVNQLGDNIVFLPVVQHLRRALPDARIVVATSPGLREVYEPCTPGVQLLTCPTAQFNGAWKRPWHLLQLIAEWRAVKPDAVLLGDDQGNVAHLLAASSGAKVVVGPDNPRLPANRLAQHRVPLDLSTLVAHQNWTLLQSLGQHLHFEVPDHPPPPDLSAMVTGASKAEVIIHPGASRDYKRWPLNRYVRLANHLAETHPTAWIIQNAKEETALSNRVIQIKPGSLSSFVSLLSHARLFIGNNSGPMNIASALGVPGLIFNGPSTPNWDPAWHREKFILLQDPAVTCQPCDRLTHPVNVCSNTAHPMHCMDVWTVERVLEQARQMLASRSR